MKEFKIIGDYIELMALLKATGIASTGGHAKQIVDEHLVRRNGVLETRRRAKIVSGDEIQINGQLIIKTI